MVKYKNLNMLKTSQNFPLRIQFDSSSNEHGLDPLVQNGTQHGLFITRPYPT